MDLQKLFSSKSSTWLWFFLTFVASFLPMIIRLWVWMDNKNINIFDIKDVLFAGLAMNLSNLNLVGSKEFDQRLPIILMSFLFIILIAARLGSLIGLESLPTLSDHVLGNVCTLILVGATIFVSHSANKYIFDTVV